MAGTIELKKDRVGINTSGSSAYDVSYYGQAIPARYPQEESREAVASPKTEVKTRTAVRVIPTHGINVLTVVGFLLAAALIVIFLSGRVELTELSDRSVTLQEQLGELKKEEAILTAKYESAFDLKEIEEIARTELGMIFPTAENVVYVTLSGEDKAEIIREDTETSSSDFSLGILSDK